MTRIALPGDSLELAYPTHNRFDLPLEFTDRKLKVLSVRDYGLLPMDARYLIKRPLIRRGRIGIRAIEDGHGVAKRWWLEAQHKGELVEYRLGLVDPKAPGDLVDWIGRIYGPTLHEHLRLQKSVRKWFRLMREKGYLDLQLMAFPGVW